ncbi:hypothetical protein MYP_4370 [Sporocytophaga myxococcoides]|uniref:Uncharacterized protein n=1 Tax=Sporocytophaga myxococcoides TaxID=153721 RepID=A0A098LJJ3_9BACT|nr:hypothetical protein MYP_4370 [Sporocytophaga myxococcoides]
MKERIIFKQGMSIKLIYTINALVLAGFKIGLWEIFNFITALDSFDYSLMRKMTKLNNEIHY